MVWIYTIPVVAHFHCHFIFRFTLVFFILLYVCYPANELKYNFNPLISNYTIILLFCYENLICSNKLLRFFPIIPFGYKSWTYLYFVCIIKVHINGDKDDIISFLCLIDTMHAYPLKKIRFEHYLSRLRLATLKSIYVYYSS